MTTGTIDLGELPHGAEPELGARWSIRDIRERLRHRATRRAQRLVGTTAAAALVLAGTAAAAPAGPLPVRELAVRATGFAVDGQTLYAVDRPDATRSAVTLTAYRLADARVRWRASLPVGGGGFGPVLQGKALLVGSGREDRFRTFAFDPDSGRRLWTHDGAPEIIGGRAVFGRWTAASSPGEGPGHVLTAVDPATGSEEWTLEMPDWGYHIGLANNPYLLTLDRRGRVTSYDLTTGEPLATRSVARPWPPPAGREGTDLHLAGSLALVVDRSGGGVDRSGGVVDIAAYDLATLTHRWTRTGIPDLAGEALGGLGVWPRPCGELVCLQGAAVPRALDPATGETVWSADWLPPGAGPGWFAVSYPGGWLDGYLLLTHLAEVPGEATQWLVDARTGRPVPDLGNWRLPVQVWAPGTAPAEPMLTWRGADGDAATWLGRLRPDRSGVELWGALDPTRRYAHCSAYRAYVVCATSPADGSAPRGVEVWRLRW